MAVLKTGGLELELIKKAGERLAYRTNSKFILSEGIEDPTDQPKIDAVVKEKKALNFS